MKALLILMIISSVGIEEIKELYSLKRYDEVILTIDKFNLKSTEAITYKAFSFYKLKDYVNSVKCYELIQNTSIDSLNFMAVESYLAIGNIVSAETICNKLPTNQKTDQLKIDIQVVKLNKTLFLPEKISSLGISNGICFTPEGSILNSSGNRLFLNGNEIFQVPGKYLGTPFIKNGKIWFAANSVANKNNANREDLSLLSKEGISKLQLYCAEYENGKVTDLVYFEHNNVEYDYVCPYIDDQGNMYFASNALGGMGGFDIYKCNLLNTGKYDKPVNIGNPINTPFDELYFKKDNNRWYFSSSGHNGHGMLDLNAIMEYKSNYSEVVNFGNKVNNGQGQYSIIINQSKANYLTTTGPDNDDLMIIDNLNKTKEVVLSATNRFTGDPIQIHRVETVYSNGFRDIKDFKSLPEIYSVQADIDQVFQNELQIESSGYNKRSFQSEEVKDGDTYAFVPNFYGTVRDYITNEPLEGVKVHLIEFGDTVAIAITDKNGEWWKALASDTEYEIIYEYPGYKDVRWKYPDVPVELSSKYGMSIDSKKGNILKIKNIYFEYAKADLKIESFEILDNIVGYLNENPTVKIELSAHTDSRGKTAANLILSKQRALSAFDYLISKGIDKSRLVPVGYGESKIINQCIDGVNCSEEQHQENRRVEMKIL